MMAGLSAFMRSIIVANLSGGPTAALFERCSWLCSGYATVATAKTAISTAQIPKIAVQY